MPVWLHHPVCISFSGSENRKKVILDFVVSPHFSLSFFTTIYIFSLSLSLYLPFCSLIISYFVFRISWYLIRLLMFYYFFMLLIEIVSEWTEWMSLGNYFIIPPPLLSLSTYLHTYTCVYTVFFSVYTLLDNSADSCWDNIQKSMWKIWRTFPRTLGKALVGLN